MSSPRRFIAPSIGLLFAAGVPSFAQTAVVTRRPMPDSVERMVRATQRQLDSLTRIYSEQGTLSMAERRKLVDAMNTLVARFAEVSSRVSPDGRTEFNVRITGQERPTSSSMSRGMFEIQAAQAQAMPKGWLGFVVLGSALPSRIEDGEFIVHYVQYPRVVSVEPSSPAQRAGIVPDDTLIAYDGRDVRDNDISLTRLLRPNAKVMVRLRRDGRLRDVPVTVAEAPQRIVIRRDDEARGPRGETWAIAGVPEAPSFPRGAMPAPMAPPPGSGSVSVSARAPAAPVAVGTSPPGSFRPLFGGVLTLANGVAGAQVTSVERGGGLAKSLGVESGVVVTSVPTGSPARESGLIDGDVIVKAGTVLVRDVVELREVVRRASENGERSVDLELVRERKPLKLTLRW